MKIIFLYLIIVLNSFQLSYSQNKTKVVKMDSLNWQIDKGTSSFETFDNRQTLLLNGKATLKNLVLSNGIIEVDVYANSKRSFAGIIFRKKQNTMEEVYMRLHKSNQPDAVQYSPTYNKELTWQLYKEYQANVNFKNKGWNTLKIEVFNNNATIFVNNEKVLVVDQLKTTHNEGAIGLFALFNNRFSNFRVTKKNTRQKIKDKDQKDINSNIISKWSITKAFPFERQKIRFNYFSKQNYKTVLTEKSGLLPFSKYIEKPQSGNFEQNAEAYAVAYLDIESNLSKKMLFSFDYSDKIIIYLNGEAIYEGNNAFRSKGDQFQGHIDINANKLYLDLKKGTNTLHCVVIDKANGWGVIGKLE